MPEFYTWAILLINQQDEIGEKHVSVFGSEGGGGQKSPLMHEPLSFLRSPQEQFNFELSVVRIKGFES